MPRKTDNLKIRKQYNVESAAKKYWKSLNSTPEGKFKRGERFTSYAIEDFKAGWEQSIKWQAARDSNEAIELLEWIKDPNNSIILGNNWEDHNTGQIITSEQILTQFKNSKNEHKNKLMLSRNNWMIFNQ